MNKITTHKTMHCHCCKKYFKNKSKSYFTGVIFLSIIFLGLFGWAGSSEAATYYISTTGSDSNSGTSESAPWQTINKVNISSFSPGDSILFKKGETWREQLTVPSSGSSGNPITFGAYGSGEKPIISGANLLITWDNTANYGSTTGRGTDTQFGNHVYFFQETPLISGTVSRIYFYIGATAPTGGHVKCALYTTDDVNHRANAFIAETNEVTSFTANAWNYCTFSSPPSVIAGTNYWTAVWSDTNFSRGLSGDSGGYGMFDSQAYGAWPDPAADNGRKNGTLGSDSYMVVSLPANIYASPLATTAYTFAENGVVSTAQANVAALNTQGEWFSDATSLYLYSTSAPTSAYSTLEAGQRTYSVNNSLHDYVDFDNLHLKGSNSHGMLIDGGSYCNISNLAIEKLGDGNDYGIMLHADSYATEDGHHTITGSTINGLYGDGIFMQRVRDVTISGCTLGPVFAGPAGNGGDATQALDSTNVTVRNNIISMQGSDTVKGGIVLESLNATDSDFLIESNDISYGNFGIGFYQADGIIISRNNIHDIGGNGIQGIDDTTDDAQITYNLVYNNTGSGINLCNSYNRTNVFVANNTLYGNTGLYGICLEQFDGTVKNNIIRDSGPVSSAAYFVTIAGGGAVDSDYNLISPESTGYINYAGSAYNTLVSYVTAKSQDAHSLNSDPLFAAAGYDFNLQSGSPAINAGVDVGLTTDYAGNAIVGNPDIGAYEYVPGGSDTAAPAAPTGLVVN